MLKGGLRFVALRTWGVRRYRQCVEGGGSPLDLACHHLCLAAAQLAPGPVLITTARRRDTRGRGNVTRASRATCSEGCQLAGGTRHHMDQRKQTNEYHSDYA